jgi:hypothetical protein
LTAVDYDNERDRTRYGYDAGNIVDGVVTLDQARGEYVVVDDDGIGFSVQDLFKSLLNKRVRFTCISFDSMEELEKLLVSSRTEPSVQPALHVRDDVVPPGDEDPAASREP